MKNLKENCIKCGKEIESWGVLFRRPENNIWTGGVVLKVEPGFGSKLDGNSYILSICDDCIEKYLHD
jgi:hypothetical protein